MLTLSLIALAFVLGLVLGINRNVVVNLFAVKRQTIGQIEMPAMPEWAVAGWYLINTDGQWESFYLTELGRYQLGEGAFIVPLNDGQHMELYGTETVAWEVKTETAALAEYRVVQENLLDRYCPICWAYVSEEHNGTPCDACSYVYEQPVTELVA